MISDVYYSDVDPVSNSREPWIIDSNCDKVTLEEGSSETLVKTKFAVNGWYRFTNMLECKKEETFKMEQSVPLTDFPMHMDAEYISTVQPRGYFRYWYRANQGGNDEFDLEFSLSFLENDVEYHKFGESRKLKYSDADKEKEGNEGRTGMNERTPHPFHQNVSHWIFVFPFFRYFSKIIFMNII